MHQKQTSFKDYSTLHLETMYTFCYKRVVISKNCVIPLPKEIFEMKQNKKLVYDDRKNFQAVILISKKRCGFKSL